MPLGIVDFKGELCHQQKPEKTLTLLYARTKGAVSELRCYQPSRAPGG